MEYKDLSDQYDHLVSLQDPWVLPKDHIIPQALRGRNSSPTLADVSLKQTATLNTKISTVLRVQGNLCQLKS